jgi:hypothetical protein
VQGHLAAEDGYQVDLDRSHLYEEQPRAPFEDFLLK